MITLQYALRAVELGADDAFALAKAANFFGLVSKDAGTADVIADQAIAVNPNPNLSVAWRMRGFISVYLGRHEPAMEQFQHSMRLNPLDPEIFFSEAGLAYANFYLRRFEIALSWANKSLAHQKHNTRTLGFAVVSYAMLGRITDAQMMLARWREAGAGMTISQIRKWMAHYRHEDVELFIEACRIAGVSE